MKNFLPFTNIALSEVAMMFFLLSDIFGLDPLKIRENALSFPIQSIFSLFISVGAFLIFLMVAERILSSKGFSLLLWIGSLALMALGVGYLRANQISALNEVNNSGLMFPVIYAILIRCEG